MRTSFKPLQASIKLERKSRELQNLDTMTSYCVGAIQLAQTTGNIKLLTKHLKQSLPFIDYKLQDLVWQINIMYIQRLFERPARHTCVMPLFNDSPLPRMRHASAFGLQALDLPEGSNGLSWIVNQGPSQLMLIPGLTAASIAAAAAGDPGALNYLRFAAQHFAALGSTQNITALDKLCIEACSLEDHNELLDFLQQPDRQQLKDIYRARMDSTTELLDVAVADGRLDSLKWLRALCQSFPSDDTGLMEVAAQHGHLSILQYLRSGPHPASWDDDVTESATPHADCLLWLLSQDPPCPFSSDIVKNLAATGTLATLITLHESAKVLWHLWDDSVCEAAATAGNLAMLQYLRRQTPPVPWTSAVCEAAAHRGDMSMLQWARAQDPPCPWDASCSAAAAHGGHIPVMEWLQAQHPPCPLDCTSCTAASQVGQLAILKWLRTRQPPVPWSAPCASLADNLGVIQWLRSQDPPCPWDKDCTMMAAVRGSLPMLQWMRAQDPPCPMSPLCSIQAANQGHLEMLQWLHQQDAESISSVLYYHAHRHTQVLKWLHHLGTPAPATVGYRKRLPAPISISSPVLMFLGDIGAPLLRSEMSRLLVARKTFCMFHGLLRWCRRAVSDPSRGIHWAFDEQLPSVTGQHLLVHLSMLPPEVTTRIAVAADLQHDLI